MSVCLSAASAHRAIKELKLLSHQLKVVHRLYQQDVAAVFQYLHRFSHFVREGVNVQLSVLLFVGKSCIKAK